MAAEPVEVFEENRPRLLGLAYRMLGSAADAEEVVQDVFLRWEGTQPGSVEAPSAWLVKVATNLCLNRLGAAVHRRERAVGLWLPEPVLTSDGSLGPLETAEQRETVSLAFLVLAERLTASERAVFILREAFGYSHREVAETIDLTEAHCRQLHRRARQRLAGARSPRSLGDLTAHRTLVERFLTAARGGDLAGLERLLAAEVTSVVDGGGMPGVARLPVRGAEKVARYLTWLLTRPFEGVTLSVAEVNGAPALLGWAGPTVVGVLVPEITAGLVTDIRMAADPAKLRFLSAQLTRLSRSAEPPGS